MGERERVLRGREAGIEGAGTREREREDGKFLQISERVRHVLNPMPRTNYFVCFVIHYTKRLF